MVDLHKDIIDNLFLQTAEDYYESNYQCVILDQEESIIDYCMANLIIDPVTDQYKFKYKLPESISSESLSLVLTKGDVTRNLYVKENDILIIQRCRDNDPWEVYIEYDMEHDYDDLINQAIDNYAETSEFGFGLRNMQFPFKNKAHAVEAIEKVKKLNINLNHCEVRPANF